MIDARIEDTSKKTSKFIKLYCLNCPIKIKRQDNNPSRKHDKKTKHVKHKIFGLKIYYDRYG